MEEKQNFLEWYQETEKKAGSLITPTNAAKMLGVSRTYIYKLIDENKLQKYTYDNLPFIGMNDINKIIIKRQQKIIDEQKDKDNFLIIAKLEKEVEEYEKIIKEKDKDSYEYHKMIQEKIEHLQMGMGLEQIQVEDAKKLLEEIKKDLT